MRWYPNSSMNKYLGTGQNRNEGVTNTDIITNEYGPYDASTNKYAAGYCKSLGSQWYLPADNELNELYDIKGSLSLTFQSALYWSSTECYGNGMSNGGTGGFDCSTDTTATGFAAVLARVQIFDGGERNAGIKGVDNDWVRCIQAF